MLNSLVKIPGVGVASAYKLLDYVWNWEMLVGLQVDELERILNNKLIAKKLYHHVHDTQRKELCQKNLSGLENKITESVIEERFQNYLDYLKKQSASVDELSKYFGTSQESVFEYLMSRKGKEIHYDSSLKVWRYGKELKLKAEKEFDIGV